MSAYEATLTNAHLRTPRAAGFAGIIFSVLLFVVFGLMRLSVPPDPFEQGAWLAGDRYVALAMNLVPFAGGAFLWFVGSAAGQAWRTRGPFFRDCILGERLFVAGDAVRGCGCCWRNHHCVPRGP